MSNVLAPIGLHHHIATLDLSRIRWRLVHKLNWDQRRAVAALKRYKEFLQQILDKPKEEIISPPDKDVDEVWHAHILHTRQYASDCKQIFGRFIHHEPHTGEQALDCGLGPCHAPDCGGCGQCQTCSTGGGDDD